MTRAGRLKTHLVLAATVLSGLGLMGDPVPNEQPSAVRQAIRSVLDLELESPRLRVDPDSGEYGFHKLDFAMNAGIALTKGGRLYAAWFAGEDGAGAYLVGTWSDDGGKTWQDTRFVVGDRHPIGKIGNRNLNLSVLIGDLWSAPDGTLRLYVYQAVNMFNGRGTLWEFVCANPDDARPSWDEPRRIGWGGLHNKPIVLADGTWLLPTDFERNLGKSATDPFPELEPLRGCGVTVSRDCGKTWTWIGRARPTGDNHFCEHAIVELADRSLLMYMRTSEGLKESRSGDGGRSWSEPRLPDTLRQVRARFGFIKLANGHLLVVKNGAAADKVNGHAREKLSAYVSDDEGRTWKGGLMLDDRRKVAYPDVFQAPDGTIYVSYDHDRKTKTDEILLARFTEEDVLNGGLKDARSFLRRTVFREGSRLAAD